MLVLVRLRSLLARHPGLYWAAIVAVASIAATVAWSATARVDAARRSWGEQRTVWVAASDVVAGEPLVVAARSLPPAAIPPGAVTSEPVQRIAVQHVGAGEVVTIADVGDGLLSMLPAGWQAVAVLTDPARLPVVPGNHVAVYADGATIAPDGLVLDVTDGTVTVAVPATAAGGVSVAARNQTAVVAVRGP